MCNFKTKSVLQNIFIFLVLSTTVYSQNNNLRFVPLKNGIDSIMVEKIDLKKDETLIKFYENPDYVVGGYSNAVNYICNKYKCKIVIENEDLKIYETKLKSNFFKKINDDFNTKIFSEMLAINSYEYNSLGRVDVFGGTKYGLYIQYGNESFKLLIYEPKHYKSLSNKHLEPLVENFYRLFEKYYLQTRQ